MVPRNARAARDSGLPFLPRRLSAPQLRSLDHVDTQALSAFNVRPVQGRSSWIICICLPLPTHFQAIARRRHSLPTVESSSRSISWTFTTTSRDYLMLKADLTPSALNIVFCKATQPGRLNVSPRDRTSAQHASHCSYRRRGERGPAFSDQGRYPGSSTNPCGRFALLQHVLRRQRMLLIISAIQNLS